MKRKKGATVRFIKKNHFEKMLYMYILQLSFNFIGTDVKESMVKKMASLLTDDLALHEYVKYRKLLRQHPGNQMLKTSYEVALTNVQLAVSRKHTDLEKTGHSTNLQNAEELMQYWGMYYF